MPRKKKESKGRQQRSKRSNVTVPEAPASEGVSTDDGVQAPPAGPPAEKKAKGGPKPKKGKKARGGKEAPGADIKALQSKAAEARSAFEAATAGTAELRAKADDAESAAKQAYAKAVGPYRVACRMAGVPCEFPGVKAEPVAPRVRFLVERVDGGVKIAIKGRDETEQTIPDAELRESVGRAAKAYCERHLGDIESQGAKFAGLGNRIRSALAGS